MRHDLCSSVHICVHLCFTFQRLNHPYMEVQNAAFPNADEKELNKDMHR